MPDDFTQATISQLKSRIPGLNTEIPGAVVGNDIMVVFLAESDGTYKMIYIDFSAIQLDGIEARSAVEYIDIRNPEFDPDQFLDKIARLVG